MSNSLRAALVDAAAASTDPELKARVEATAAEAQSPRRRKHHKPTTNTAEVTVTHRVNSDNGTDGSVTQLKIRVTEDPTSVTFEHLMQDNVTPAGIKSTGKLFYVLREALLATKGPDYYIQVKTASQIKPDNVPCLQDPATLTMYFDPLLPYRSPVEVFVTTGKLVLLKMPSQRHYYRATTPREGKASQVSPAALRAAVPPNKS